MTDPATRRKKMRLPGALQCIAWPLAALGLLLLFNTLFTPGYLHIGVIDGRFSGYLVDIFRDGSTIMLVALGMTLVIATGGVDLSVGAVMAISAVVSAAMVTPEWLDATLGPWAVQMFANNLGVWLVVLIVTSLFAALIAGAWNGMLVSVLRIQPIIATLILMVAGRGAAQLICEGQIFTYDVPKLSYIGKGTLLGMPFSVWLVAVMILATYLLTRRTALGLMIEAVGDNDLASYYTGIRARTIKFLVYVFCGFCAGIAGLIESTNVSSANANQIGLWYELDAIFAVVVGGTALTGGRFLIFGTVIGALLIQTLTNTMIAQKMSPEVALIPKALVIVIVCLLQSSEFRRKVFGSFQRKQAGRANAVATPGGGEGGAA